MEKVNEFLVSLVKPLKMVRFRSMSALISIIIFLLSVQLLYLPAKKDAKNDAVGYKDLYILQPLLKLPNSEDIKDFSVELQHYDVKFDLESKKLTWNDELTENIEKHFTFTLDDGYTKKLHVFLYVFPNKEPNIDVKNGFQSSDYPYVENEEDYFLVITEEAFYFQYFTKLPEGETPTEHIDMNGKPITIEYPRNENIPAFGYATFDEFSLTSEEPSSFGNFFGPEIGNKIILLILNNNISGALINSLMTAFLLPLLFIFIFWLVFRKSGYLKLFKEYFNIAAISSIIPFLVTFGIAWSYPAIITWYIFIFSLYYIFVLYKINNSPQLV